MKEIWVDIKDFEGLYQVSNYGRVKSLERYDALGRLIEEKILKHIKQKSGHLFVYLSKNGVEKRYYIHQLVAMHFIPNPECKTDVHHKDHNPANNNVENLVWLTHEEHKAEHPEVFEASAKARSRHINQYTLDGKFIKKWDSARDIKRELGYSPSNIITCCNGKYRQAYGYIWKYAEDC